MNSKTDKQIKRYLKSISDSLIESKVYGSIHYKVRFEKETVDIRLGDHYSSHSEPFIDIIKVTDAFYNIRVGKSIMFNVNANDCLIYVKALLLVGDQFKQTCDTYLNKLDNVKKEMELANQRNKSIAELSEALRKANKKQEEFDLTLKNKNDKIKSQIDEMNNLRNKIAKIRNIL